MIFFSRLEKPRSKQLALSEAYKGGVVPVALMYDEPDDLEVKRPLRETVEEKKVEETEQTEEEPQKEETEDSDDVKGSSKNSKLLSLEARETDDDIRLGIQSRNKIPSIDEPEELIKPFVYNVQPLSFYTPETKAEQHILDYINKIKEIRDNQIQSAKKTPETKPSIQKVDKVTEAVVTDADTESDPEEEGPIRRKMQHYETVIKPMAMDPQMYGAFPQGGYPISQGGYPFPQGGYHPSQGGLPVYPASTHGMGFYPQAYQQSAPASPFHPNPFTPTVVYLPNPFKSEDSSDKLSTKSNNGKIFDDYFPILINNPFNEIWAGITNIVEYGPAADVCRKNKKARVADEDSSTETIIDLPSRGILHVGNKKDEIFPKFARLKVRRGGVAIAGPGGIATAGSGGTAIVGPGGTAYTTREGTAVVGPGGRVVHVPQFPIYAKNVDETEPRSEFVPPPGSRMVAEGPIVYYDNPLDQEEIPDPAIPF